MASGFDFKQFPEPLRLLLDLVIMLFELLLSDFFGCYFPDLLIIRFIKFRLLQESCVDRFLDWRYFAL